MRAFVSKGGGERGGRIVAPLERRAELGGRARNEGVFKEFAWGAKNLGGGGG